MKKDKKNLVPGGVLALGEATGHSHRAALLDPDTQGEVEVYEGPHGREIHASADTITIVHEEHRAIIMPGGVYETGIVVEQDHIENARRNVID